MGTLITREMRKEKTMELAQKLRDKFKLLGIDANVGCHFYRNSPCMVIIRPGSKAYKALDYWEQTSLKKGLEHYAKAWDNNEQTYKDYCNIYGG
jgi:hypothetical protein